MATGTRANLVRFANEARFAHPVTRKQAMGYGYAAE